MNLFEGSQVIAVMNEIQEDPFQRIRSLIHATDLMLKNPFDYLFVGNECHVQ